MGRKTQTLSTQLFPLLCNWFAWCLPLEPPKSNDCDFGSITVLLSRLQTASMGIRHGRLDRSDKLPGVCTPPTNL